MLYVAALVLLMSENGNLGASRPVPWSEVRSAIAETICIATAEHEGREYFAVAETGRREECGLSPPSTAVERAVAAAFDEAGPLLASLRLGERVHSKLKGTPNEQRAVAREVFLAEPEYLRGLMRRLQKGLSTEGLVCEGCPTFEKKPVRKITWGDFAPYLGAHVWPDRVEPELDAEGRLTGERRYGFHICVGLNGVSEMKDPDPVLVRAAWLLAMETPAVRETAGKLFSQILNEPEFQSVEDDEGKTRYLRRRLPSAVPQAPEVERGVCDTLQRYVEDLGLAIADCEDAGK